MLATNRELARIGQSQRVGHLNLLLLAFPRLAFGLRVNRLLAAISTLAAGRSWSRQIEN